MGNKESSKKPVDLAIKKTTLFKQDQHQVCCLCCKTQITFRIPALIYLNDSQGFLAFCEKRKTASDTNAELLVMRRGTWKDWKNKELQWDSGYRVLTSASLPNHRTMNPVPVLERESNILFLFFTCIPTGVSEHQQLITKRNQARLCYVTSEDAGKTWSQITDLSVDGIGNQMREWATFTVGPGHGLQMTSGRLIIPAYAYSHTGQTSCTSCSCDPFCCFTSYSFAFFSDDKGSTWKVGKPLDVESGECQMAEIKDDKGNALLYCNSRSRSGFRTEALSFSSGESFDYVLAPQRLKETGKGCQGSILSFREQSSAANTWLLYSHPTDPKKRQDLGVYLNKTPWDPSGWPDEPSLMLHNGPSAYSDLVEYVPGHFACLMECGTESDIEEIAFVMFDLPDQNTGK